MAYDSNTGTITRPINFKDISDALSIGSGDLGTLCSSQKINKWAKSKPFRMDKVGIATYEDRATLRGADVQSVFGLRIPSPVYPSDWNNSYAQAIKAASMKSESYSFLPPRGLNTGIINEWFRALDFDGYMSDPEPPLEDSAPVTFDLGGSLNLCSFVINFDDETSQARWKSSGNIFFYELLESISLTRDGNPISLADCYLAVAITDGRSYNYGIASEPLSDPDGSIVTFGSGSWPFNGSPAQLHYYVAAALYNSTNADQAFYSLPFRTPDKGGAALNIVYNLPLKFSVPKMENARVNRSFASLTDATTYLNTGSTFFQINDNGDLFVAFTVKNNSGIAVTLQNSNPDGGISNIYCYMSGDPGPSKPSWDAEIFNVPVGAIGYWDAFGLHLPDPEESPASSVLIPAGETMNIAFYTPGFFRYDEDELTPYLYPGSSVFGEYYLHLFAGSGITPTHINIAGLEEPAYINIEKQ